MGALDGIKVLDLSRVLAGPWSTMTLADLGAEVWKIEPPQGGDDTRHWSPPEKDGVSTYFMSVNRNKKSVALDLNTPEGLETVRALAVKADVLVENYRPATLKRWGLTYEKLKVLNPRLIVCSISGYGRDGAFADRPGYDFVLQAECGFMAITGEADGAPMRLGVAFIDIITGMNAVQAILAALYARERTGEGQWLDISLLDSGLACLANIATGYLNTGREPARFGNAHPSIVPYETFECSDAVTLAVAVGTDEQYRRLCQNVLEAPALWEEERYRTNRGRIVHRLDLIPALQRAFARYPSTIVMERMRAHAIPVGEVRAVSAALESAEARAREMVVTAVGPEGNEVRMVRSALRFSGTPVRAPEVPPALGAHTAEVLKEVLKRDL
jgi:crotonobetainyl-CoA:carnitine CoA-transferase CaiB-like acyl-CoA transferase